MSDDDMPLLVVKDLGRLIAGTRIATGTAECVHLNAAVAAALGVTDEIAARVSWPLLLEAANQEDDAGGPRRPFVATRHLLGLIEYPKSLKEEIPGTGQTAEQLSTLAKDFKITKLDSKSTSQRRLFAAVAGGYGADRTSLNPRELGTSRPTGPIDDLAKSIWKAMRALMADSRVVEPLIDQAEREQVISDSELEPVGASRGGIDEPPLPAHEFEIRSSSGSLPAEGSRPAWRRHGTLVAAGLSVALIAVMSVVIAKNWESDPSDRDLAKPPASSPSPSLATPSPSATSASTSAPAPSAPTSVGIGTIQSGWGPKREMFKLSDGGAPYPAFNSISDNPNIGDERNFVGLRMEGSTEGSNWTDGIWADPEDIVVMRVYFENSGYDQSRKVTAGWLQGAKLKLGMSQRDSRTWDVFAVLKAKNAKTVWDGSALHVEEGSTVSFDLETALLENNAHPNGGIKLDPSIATSQAVTLGYARMNGVIKPGYKYAGYVTIKLHVVGAASAAGETPSA